MSEEKCVCMCEIEREREGERLSFDDDFLDTSSDPPSKGASIHKHDSMKSVPCNTFNGPG